MFEMSCGSVLGIDVFTSLVTYLRGVRPVLVCSWLRWALNSLPTSSRLHDSGFSRRRFCNGLSDNIRHVIECEAPFRVAAVVIGSRRRRGWSGDSLIGGMPSFGLASESALFGQINDTPAPISFTQHVCERLGLRCNSLVSFRARLELLFLVQHMFCQSRRAAGVGIDVCRLQDLANAAWSSLY